MEDLHTLQGLVNRLNTYGDRLGFLEFHQDDVTRWSYGEIATAAQHLANGLVRLGLRRGEYVPLLAANRTEWLIACLAVMQAGGAIVPLDTQIKHEALERILPDSEARFIFTTTEYLNRLHQTGVELRPILFDVASNDERGWQALCTPESTTIPTVTPDEPATMFYTSGTTGIPKGVPLTHRNITFQISSILQTGVVTPQDRVMLPLPMYHVYPFTIGMLIPVSFGLPLVLPQSLVGPQLVRAMNEGEVTVVVGVPRLYRALYSGIEAQVKAAGPIVAPVFAANMRLSIWLRRHLGIQAGRVLFRSLHKRFGEQLRLMTSGGSALDPALAWKLEGLGWQVAIGYGLTETSPILTLNQPPPSELAFSPEGSNRLASAGKALPGIKLRLDHTAHPAEHADENGAADQGEIMAQGMSVFSGYRNLPDQTAEVFTGDGWFRTGDLGTLDADGYLYISGRASTLIVTEGGKNVQPEPVEEVYQHSPFVREIGILQHDNQLVGLIMPEMDEVNKQRNGDVARAMREAINTQGQTLPSYQQISDYATTPEPLPRTNLGKIRRHLLPELFAQAKQGLIEKDTTDAGPLLIADMSEKDRALLDHAAAREVWDWLAAHYPDRRLTPDTSPQLDLGVDSLAWLSLTLAISERTGVELGNEAIQRITSVRDLLREVNEGAERGAPPSATIANPEEVITPEQQHWLSPQPRRLELLGAAVFALVQLLARWLFRLEVRGRENLPSHGNFVMTPNHTSYLDAPVVAAALHYTQMRQTYWAGSVEIMFQHPIMRLISRIAQVMPVGGANTVGTGLSSLAFAAITVKRHKNLVWFPEGRIDPAGEMLPFREGIGIVLNHYQVPVVPVYIEGARDALPLGAWLPRLKPVTITFGQPCLPQDLAEQGEGDTAPACIANALQQQVIALRDSTDHRAVLRTKD